MNNRLSRIAIAALMLTTALAALPRAAWGQPATTAPVKGQPSQTADPNKMADEAMDLIERGERDAAAALIQTITQIDPGLPRLQLAAARLMVLAGKGPQAIRYYEQFTQTTEGKTDHRPYAEMGRLYIRSKSYRNARRNLEQAKTLAPEQDEKTNKYTRAEIAMDYAEVLHLLEDDKEAIKVAREAAVQASKDARIQIQFSRLLQIVSPKETKEIRDVASRGAAIVASELETDLFSPQKLQLLREALLTVENTWATDAVNQKDNPEPVYLLSLATQDVAEINQRLALLAAKEYAERAVKLAQDAVAVSGAKPQYMIRLAEIEAKLGSTRTAVEKLDEILKADPDNAAAIAMKAQIASMPVRKIGVSAGQ